MKNFLFAAVVLVLFSCKKEEKGDVISSTTTEIRENYIKKGDSVATVSQAALLSRVSGAIQKGGIPYAVEFCSTKAIPLTDSLSGKYNVEIQRITEKNRNPQNYLKTETDRKMYASFASDPKLKDALASENGKQVYYKKISLAMPACTKCHGILGKDIDDSTYEKIIALYPKDRATGYTIGNFRGMWKITFND